MAAQRKIRQSPGKRRLFAGLVALWVSLGIQPCAVAAVSDADCPHCPPEVSDPQPAMERHCDTAESAAILAATDCCEAGEAAIDGRLTLSDLKPVDSPVAAPPPDPARFSPAWIARPSPAADPPDRWHASIALHKLYCVYRD